MATGTIILPIQAAVLPDGSASNAGPALLRVKGTDTSPSKHYLIASFDASTDEHLWWAFQMPANYASGLLLKLLWYTNDTGASESCVWGCQIAAITESDADTPIEHAKATAQTTTTDVNAAEANRLIQTSITISNDDSVSAGDLVFLLVYRDANNGSDDLTSDANLVAVSLDYTTT